MEGVCNGGVESDERAVERGSQSESESQSGSQGAQAGMGGGAGGELGRVWLAAGPHPLAPVEGRNQYDIGVPELSRAIIRRQDLGAVITALDVGTLQIAPLSPMPASLGERLPFEGYDLLTREKELEREYVIPEVQTPQEVISFYAEEIARQVKAPGHFAPIAVRVREFFDKQAFGREVDIEAPGHLPAIASRGAGRATIDVFVAALRPHLLTDQKYGARHRRGASTPRRRFPSRAHCMRPEHSVFNFQACDNEFERSFAAWLDHAPGCKALAKLPSDSDSPSSMPMWPAT